MMKKYFSWIVIIILILPPIVSWKLMTPLSARFLDFNVTMTSLGQISALIGLSLFAITLILAARIQLIDKLFVGLNRAYIRHHQLASVAFILLMLHPLFLAAKYLQFSTQSAAQFLLPSAYLPRTYGIIALLLMMYLLILTFYIKLRYHVWKFSHKFLGLAFIIAVLHILTIPSDISRNMFIRDYLLILSILAIAAFLYRSVFNQIFVKKYKYKVDEVKRLPAGYSEIVMSPIGKMMKYKSGQFIFVSFLSDAVSGEEHPFTISSANGEKKLKIMVRALGDYTAKLLQMPKGAKAIIEGPYGAFQYENGREKQVWVGGGVGITPFMSMAKGLDGKHDVILYYATKGKIDAVGLNELEEIAKKKPNFKVINFRSDERGFLTVEILKAEISDMKQRDFFICGPPAMMKSLRAQLNSFEVGNDKIFTEEFGL